MNSNLLGIISIAIGVVVMALTLVVIYNPFGMLALPTIVIGVGSIVTVIVLLIAFTGSR